MTGIELSTATVGRSIGGGFRRLLGRRVALVDRLAFVAVALLLLFGAVGPLVTPFSPYEVDPARALLAPGAGHLLGTDDAGRDVLSRILAGAGTTLLAAVGIVVLSMIVGVLVASVATLLPRWADEAIMRVCDIFMSVPSLVLALGLAAAIGPSLTSIVIAMVAASWPGTARLVRGILRETMCGSYVEAAQVLGVSRLRLMLRHALPNSMDAVYVQASMEISGTIVMMAGLAFLGVGAPPPSPDWGSLVAQGQQFITSAWWVALFPGIAITISAIAFGLVGDAVRGLVDPSSRRAR
ncbi:MULTISPECIES: ABC transporter permease [unclassified Nonomuraea]|uniref:ABC transporter permease n=1 Tax=Nonomuraea sp. NPDC047529 TaxID=3155623 RepID=UPI0033C1F386